jgi:hypothetical protein
MRRIGKLTVLLKSGRTYVYQQVPEDVFRGFASARSKGAFFNGQIRNRYPFEELSAA